MAERIELFKRYDVTQETPITECPHCNAPVNAWTGERPPGEGDYSICAHCTGINRFTAAKTLRAVTPEEETEFMKSEAGPLVTQFRRSRNRNKN